MPTFNLRTTCSYGEKLCSFLPIITAVAAKSCSRGSFEKMKFNFEIQDP
jgi:hypothetical protein